MVTRTFLSKCNTIVNGSKNNFGLNPVCTLNYGKTQSRVLLYFDAEKIMNLANGGKIGAGTTHHLKMFNCGSWDPRKFMEKKEIGRALSNGEVRAASFDIILFKLPQAFDAGTGFDDSTDVWFVGRASVSEDGSTWYKSENGLEWDAPGVYTSEFLWKEYEKWGNGEESIVIGRQHFDYGNENLDIDITDYVNSIIKGGKNYGLGMAFSPRLELSKSQNINYATFFTSHTNTFFEPYVETRTNTPINDDRYKFYFGKDNKLYFYAILGGIYTDLDELPVCTIEGVKYPVKRQNTGIYYAEVNIGKKKSESLDECGNSVTENTPREESILYDVWSNLKYNGEDLGEVEMEFRGIPASRYMNLGGEIEITKNIVPTISGINDDEKIYQGDKRELDVVFRVQYSQNEYELADNSFYRIYVKDGTREIDVIDWDAIDTLGRKNTFSIDTSELIPYDYYVDIKLETGRETRIFKNRLHFKVVDNVTEIRR